MCYLCEQGHETKTTQELGLEFGYPQCCIDDFRTASLAIRTGENDPRTENQHRAAKHGFVPCAAHADQIVTGDIKIETLIENRDPKHGRFSPFV